LDPEKRATSCLDLQAGALSAEMVRFTPQPFAQIGRLTTPPAEALGGQVEGKVKDFFREVCYAAQWS